MRGRVVIKAMFSNWLVIVTCCAILVVNILFYYFFIRHQEETIAHLERQYSLARRASLHKGGGGLESLRQTKRRLDSFIAAVPQEAAFPQLVHQVYGMIQKAGLSSSTMAFKPQQVGRLSMVRYASSFKVTGTYGQIKRFLAELLDSKSLLCIDGFVLQRDKASNRVSMTLKLSLYLR